MNLHIAEKEKKYCLYCFIMAWGTCMLETYLFTVDWHGLYTTELLEYLD